MKRIRKLYVGIIDKMLDRLFFWLLERYAPQGYEGINEEKRDGWLLSLVISDGFKSFVKYRDLQIMKSLSAGLDRDMYIRLVGQRAELLYLIGESKRIYERHKKDRSGAKGDSENV